MLINTIWERVYPTDFRFTRFQGVADKFLCPLSTPLKMWQQTFGHNTSERFVPRGRVKVYPFCGSWSHMGRQQLTIMPHHYPHWRMPVVLQMVVAGGELGIGNPSPGAPSVSFSLHWGFEDGWRAHLQDLTVAGMWTEEEDLPHISILEIRHFSWFWVPFSIKSLGTLSLDEWQCYSSGILKETIRHDFLE